MKSSRADTENLLKRMAQAPTAESRSAPAGAVPRSGPIPAKPKAKK